MKNPHRFNKCMCSFCCLYFILFKIESELDRSVKIINALPLITVTIRSVVNPVLLYKLVNQHLAVRRDGVSIKAPGL